MPNAERKLRIPIVVHAVVPGTDPADTVTLATRLRGEGIEPVSHIVGRRIKSLAAVDDFLARLAANRCDTGARRRWRRLDAGG
jgi:hypothetical protein